jgi:hypothetical protein
MTTNTFYTYAWLRVDRTPYYIGKGCGNRAYTTHKKGVGTPPPLDRILILKQGLIEENAFKHEVYMIAVFGRKDLGTGILRNRTNGGDGPAGAVRSEETRTKIGIAAAGRVHSKSTLKKMSDSRVGIPKSKEHKDKISAANKGKKHTKESLQKMSGENNHRYGKIGTMHGKTGEDNHNFGKKRWVNALGERRYQTSCPGPDWQRGMKWKT